VFIFARSFQIFILVPTGFGREKNGRKKNPHGGWKDYEISRSSERIFEEKYFTKNYFFLFKRNFQENYFSRGFFGLQSIYQKSLLQIFSYWQKSQRNPLKGTLHSVYREIFSQQKPIIVETILNYIGNNEKNFDVSKKK